MHDARPKVDHSYGLGNGTKVAHILIESYIVVLGVGRLPTQ